MNKFYQLLEWFIPESFRNEGQGNLLRKTRLLIRTFPLIFILLASSIYHNYVTTGSLSIPHLLALVFLSFTPIILKFFKSYKVAAYIIPLTGLIMAPISVYFEGGLTSQPVITFTVIPLMSIFFLGRGAGLWFSIVTILEIAVFVVLHNNNAIPEMSYSTDTSYWYYAFGVASIVALVTHLSYQYEKSNAKFYLYL